VFFCRADNDYHGLSWGNTAQALVWWEHLGALHEATNTLHQLMYFTPFPHGGMVVKIAVNHFNHALAQPLIHIAFVLDVL
jgi:hypothetical protein